MEIFKKSIIKCFRAVDCVLVWPLILPTHVLIHGTTAMIWQNVLAIGMGPSAASVVDLVSLNTSFNLCNLHECSVGEGMTPAASNTCYDKYSNCASLCQWYPDDCKASCGKCWICFLWKCFITSSVSNVKII